MLRAVARHNINLDREERRRILACLLFPPEDGEAALRRFEDAFAAYHGRRFAIGAPSGRLALYAILNALKLPPGAEVAVPAYSFHTLPAVVRQCGLRPVFVPCDTETYAPDPERLPAFLSERTAAVIVEHPFGQAAPADDIERLARKIGAHLIEDPSQSIGADLHGRKAGAFGRAACVSLVHGKNLTAFGGGAVLTDDEDLYAELLRLRLAGPRMPRETVKKALLGGLANWAATSPAGYRLGPFWPFYLWSALDREALDARFEEAPRDVDPSGFGPLSGCQALLAALQLDRLDERNRRRRQNAERIREGLSDTGLRFQREIPGSTGTWNALAVRVQNPPAFQRALMLRGVDTRADYMTVFAFHEEWEKAGRVVYLPSHPGMTDADVRHVIRSVRRVLERGIGV